MTFARYEFDARASIHEHFHPQEEVYHIIEGELELTIGGSTQRLLPGCVGRPRQYATFGKGDLERQGHHRGLSLEGDSGAAVKAPLER